MYFRKQISKKIYAETQSIRSELRKIMYQDSLFSTLCSNCVLFCILFSCELYKKSTCYEIAWTKNDHHALNEMRQEMLKTSLESRECQLLNGGDKIFHLVLSKKKLEPLLFPILRSKIYFLQHRRFQISEHKI